MAGFVGFGENERLGFGGVGQKEGEMEEEYSDRRRRAETLPAGARKENGMRAENMKALIAALDKFPEARKAMIRVWDAEENDENREDGARS